MWRYSCLVLAIVHHSICVVSAQTSPICSQFNNYQEYESSWSTQYAGYAERGTYPFGTGYCDSNATSDQKTSGLNANIKFAIPFYGAIYRSLMISSDGFVTLDESPSTNSGTLDYMSIRWPNMHYSPHSSGAVDPPLIAPFYAEMDFRIGQPNDPGQLSWRVLERSASGSSIADGMLDRLSEDVRRASVDAERFVAQSGVVVTWYNVTYSRATTCATAMNVDTCPRNTVQMALVTNSRQTYVIFNYVNITWVGSGNAQHCDPATGMPSANSPQCQPAQVGFNAGSGRGFTSLPYSTVEGVARLDKLSGTDVIGRWIYHVTGNVIRHAGCTTDPSLAESHKWPLVANPSHGAMLGGHWVNVSGPCFDADQKVRCWFGEVETMAIYWGNPMQVTCVQPPLTTVGPVRLSVSVDQGQNYNFSTVFSILQQERVDQSMSVAVVNPTANWLNTSRIELSWNATSLASSEVIVQLFGYNHGHWDLLHTFNSTQIPNTGSYSIVSPPSSLCTEQNPPSHCMLYSFGAFRVSGLHNYVNRSVPRTCVNVTSHSISTTPSTGTPPPWKLCFGESREVIIDWILPPCGRHRNATMWPRHLNDSGVMLPNKTALEASWLCTRHNSSSRQVYPIQCAKNISNILHRSWQFNVTSLPNRNESACIHYLEDDNRLPLSSFSLARSMWSSPVPLGWFMNAAATSSEGADWPHQRCAKWQSEMPESGSSEQAAISAPESSWSETTTTSWRPTSMPTPSTNWLSPADFLPCPCTLNQAKIDFGRFQQSLDCNVSKSESKDTCWTNRDALGCFQSVHTSSSGASNRCCYDNDGNLMYAGDSDSGSHTEYSAPWGLMRASRKVPSLDHWRDDLIPFYYCCGWQQPPAKSPNFVHDCFNVYAMARPTVDCKFYRPPGLGAVYGDPHFITFDANKYSFNGWGEFWLVRIGHQRNTNKRSRDTTWTPGDSTRLAKISNSLPFYSISPPSLPGHSEFPPRDTTWTPGDSTRLPKISNSLPLYKISPPSLPRHSEFSPRYATRPSLAGWRNSNQSMEGVEFALQGRFEPAANQTNDQQPTGTVLTAVAMQQIDTAVISITVNDHNAEPRLLVYYDNVTVDFTDPNMFWQQFHDVIIISNDQECSNVTVIFHQSGIGVNVAWKNGAMHAIVSLPPRFKMRTEGLLGQWNGEHSNDLIPRESYSTKTGPVSASDPSAIYYDFGLSWIVQPNETLFTYLYRAAMDYDYYRHSDFVPSFNVTMTSSSVVLSSTGTSSAVCGNNAECLYDYAATGNPNLAADTLAAAQWDTEARAMAQPVVSCGWLDIPYSVRQGQLRYTVGSQVTVVGCMPGYSMTGVVTTYICELTSTATNYSQTVAVWSPSIAQTCYWLGGGMPSAEKTAIIIPVVIIGFTIVVALVAVLIISGIKRRKRRRQQRANEKKQQPATASSAAAFADPVAVISNAPGPGKTAMSPLIIPVVGAANEDPETVTPEVTEITATTAFNRVVRGSMSESSLLDQRESPAAQQRQQRALSNEIAMASAPPPRYSLVSTSTVTSGTASTINSVLCGPVRLMQPPSVMIAGSQSHLDTTVSDVFPLAPADDTARQAGTLAQAVSSTSVRTAGSATDATRRFSPA